MSVRLDNALLVLPGRRAGVGSMETQGGRILGIEMDSAARADKLLIPGLVNAHAHSAMTLMRGLGSGLPLDRWLHEAIFPVEAKLKAAHVLAGAKWAAREMVAGGTTTVADMYDFPDEGEKAFAAAGMRANTCTVALPFIPGRIGKSVEYASSPALGPLAMRDLCVHSEYLSSEEACFALAEANRTLCRPVHVHVSETKAEHEECIKRHGKTPMEYLASTGLFDHGGYAAHCVWCTDGDFELMREKGVSLVHNPTSNLKLGSGIARVKRAMELGVNVALGTDGCASNDDLDMFEEMRLAALLACGTSHDPAALSAWDAIEMATANGARALGREGLGVLEPGAPADFAVIDLKGCNLTPALDAANVVVYSAHASDVMMTVVDGKVVYDRSKPDGGAADRAEFLGAVRDIGLGGFS